MAGGLAGSSIAITGAARGIGSATAERLVRKGARVAIGDIDAAGARRAAEHIGGEAVGLPLDVSDRESFGAFLDAAAEAQGPLDCLVANAGLMPLGPFLEGDHEKRISGSRGRPERAD